ncbi:hypothetical protein FD42_GL001204 [Lentilactobacillus hilgardii DSM 20176 = ATCC 8290]|nr:hypothetical protein FD42_GL001204 [Lentilactobacillus hilgardii DSM 20176 = ATCC 8290]
MASAGVSTPADAALLMNLGSDGTFIGSEIFKSRPHQNLPKPLSRKLHILPITS